MSQAGTLDSTNNNPQIPTQFDTDNGTAVPIANTLEILGETVANGTDVKPLYTTGAANVVTVNVQVGAAIAGAPPDKNDAGLVSFDNTDFTVDANGFVEFIGGGGTVFGLLSDQGLPSVGPDGNGDIGILGGTGINTTGQDPATAITINLDVPVTVPNGGTGNTSLTDGGILLGSGAGAVTVTAQPTNGQLLIGSSGVDPVLNTLTEGTGIDILNGAGSITISVDTSELPTIATTYTTDSGDAIPAANVLIIAGGEGIDTSGAGNTVTISGELATAAATVGAANIGISAYLNDDFSVTAGFVELADTVVKSIATDSGTVTPSGHSFTATGTGGITTSGSGSTLTIDGSGISGGVAAPTNISNGLGTWNLGMSYSAGTVTIHGADGNALSGSNIGYVTIRSNVSPGELVTYSLTSNYTFEDSVGTSVFAGSTFGFLPTDATSTWLTGGLNAVPFYLYAVADDNDANLIFACSRIPTFTIATSSAFFNAASGSADTVASLLTLQSVTISNYQNNPVQLVGSFEMTKISGDWTVTNVTSHHIGFGSYAKENYSIPSGTITADANNVFVSSGGTAPTINSSDANYTIDPFTGMCRVRMALSFNTGVAAGTGNLLFSLSAPITQHNTFYTPMQFLQSGSQGQFLRVDLFPNVTPPLFNFIKLDGSTAMVQFVEISTITTMFLNMFYCLEAP